MRNLGVSFCFRIYVPSLSEQRRQALGENRKILSPISKPREKKRKEKMNLEIMFRRMLWYAKLFLRNPRCVCS